MLDPTPGSANVSDSNTLNADLKYIVINEIVSSNSKGIVDEDGDSGDWIELYNTSSTVTVNMSGARLANSVQWVFPSITIAPQSYLLVWADSKNKTTTAHLHANFNISSAGELLTLYNTDGVTVVDQADITAIPTDYSYGRYPNGTGSFQEMSTTTPLAANVATTVTPNVSASNIIINEVLTSNTSGLKDEDGEYNGWIELYNKGTVAIDMDGLRLSDSSRVWQFPSMTLGAGEYLLVFASGKGRTGGELHTNFTFSTTESTTLLFLNTDNSIIESVNVPVITSNTSYGRSPNATGSFKTYTVTTPGYVNTDTAVSANANAKYIVINEVISKNSKGIKDEDGDQPDWIELYNTSSTVSVSLSGLKLRNTPFTWVMPDVTMPPNTYLVLFASGKDRRVTTSNLHTNFNISSSGDIISLYNTDDTLLSSVVIPVLDANVSYGRYPDGAGSFQLLALPTPGAANSSGNATILSVSISSDTWSIGTVSPASVTTMTSAQKITVANNGNVTSKYALNVVNPSGWTASTSSADSEKYVLNAAFDSDGSINWSVANHVVSTISAVSSATKFAGDEYGINVQEGESRTLYLQFYAPTVTSVISEQNVGLVVTAEAQ